jgi:hypothetical protein
LTLYPSRLPVWILLGAAVLATVSLVYTLPHSHRLGPSLTALIALPCLLAAAAWLGFTRTPVLDVDIRGVRAPLFFQRETVGWGRIAVVRKGDSWAQSSLEVFFWVDARDHTQGTKGGVHIPALALPMKIDAVVAEVQRIQAAATTERHDGP